MTLIIAIVMFSLPQHEDQVEAEGRLPEKRGQHGGVGQAGVDSAEPLHVSRVAGKQGERLVTQSHTMITHTAHKVTYTALLTQVHALVTTD